MTLSNRSSLRQAAAEVAVALKSHGVAAVLTGGACASLWSRGQYKSFDIDFVIAAPVARQRLDEAMSSVGFRREGDRYLHPVVRFWVEFPRGPLGIGSDLAIRPIEVAVGRRRVLALSPTDSCRDRLAAFYFWGDRQSLETAVLIASRNTVNTAGIRGWSVKEGHEDRFEEFHRAVTALRGGSAPAIRRRRDKPRRRD